MRAYYDSAVPPQQDDSAGCDMPALFPLFSFFTPLTQKINRWLIRAEDVRLVFCPRSAEHEMSSPP